VLNQVQVSLSLDLFQIDEWYLDAENHV
jgi:hypothetical protein